MTASHRTALGIGGGRRTPSPFRLGLRSHFGEGSSVARRRVAAVALCAATAFALAVPVDNVSAEECNCTSITETTSAACLASCGAASTAVKAGIVANENVKPSISAITGTAIQAGLSLIGVVFLILMIYGGIKWMIARGDSGEVDKAREVIKAAITGIVIVALAFAITRFIIDKIGGAAG